MASEPSKIVVAAALCLSLCRPLFAEDGPSPPDGANAVDSVTVGVLGAQVAIDPQTGRLRPPTAEQAAALREQLRVFLDGRLAAPDGEPVEYRADGSMTKVVGVRHMQFAVARLDGAGELETACVAGPEAAATFMGGAGE